MAENPKQRSRIGRHAFSTVASASFGVLTSVLLDVVVIALFGMGKQTDAYFVAVTIPQVIITILILQATRVVQPLFISKRQTAGDAAAWRYFNLLLTSGTAIVTAACGIGALLSPMLMKIQLTGSTHAEVSLAARLSFFLFLILPLYFPIVLMRVALQSFEIFALPGAMKLFENAFKIIFVVFLGKLIGVQALILGMLAGSLCQICCFYFVLRQKGFRFQPILRFRHEDMIQAYSLLVFPLVGQFLSAGMEVLSNNVGSMSGEGNVSALRLAGRIIDGFSGLLAGSIVIAAMPSVAVGMAARNPEVTKNHVRRALYLLLLVTLPLSIWLGLMHVPLMSFLYQRGSVTNSDTALVSNILLLLIPYIFLSRFMGLLELPFFAEQNTRTPLVGSVLQAAAFGILSLIMVSKAGIYAVPTGRSISYVVSCCFLIWSLRRRLGNIGLMSIRSSAARILVASLIMSLFIVLGNSLAKSLPSQIYGGKLLSLFVPSAAGAAALTIALFYLGLLDLTFLEKLPYFSRWRSRLFSQFPCPKKLI